jgi:hypothetical protein
MASRVGQQDQAQLVVFKASAGITNSLVLPQAGDAIVFSMHGQAAIGLPWSSERYGFQPYRRATPLFPVLMSYSFGVRLIFCPILERGAFSATRLCGFGNLKEYIRPYGGQDE